MDSIIADAVPLLVGAVVGAVGAAVVLKPTASADPATGRSTKPKAKDTTSNPIRAPAKASYDYGVWPRSVEYVCVTRRGGGSPARVVAPTPNPSHCHPAAASGGIGPRYVWWVDRGGGLAVAARGRGEIGRRQCSGG